MSNYKNNNATYALNSYVWKLLEANLGWKKSDYNGLIPIIPLSQQPELMETGRPFIVYSSNLYPSTHLYALKSESVAYTIYATSVAEANNIAGLLTNVFERQDEAADDVNQWLKTEQAGRNVSRNISFGTIKNSMAQKAEPTEEEGGFVAAFVLLETKYTETPNPTLTTRDFIY